MAHITEWGRVEKGERGIWDYVTVEEEDSGEDGWGNDRDRTSGNGSGASGNYST